MKPNVKLGPTLKRIWRTLIGFYPVMLPVTLLCILFSAAVSAVPSVFMQKIIAIIEECYPSKDWAGASGRIFGIIVVLAALYVVSLVSVFLWNRLMAIITQGTLKKLRCKMFDGMQDLPIRYFDTNSHGDIMSFYTNDIDTLRQLISQSLPNLLNSGVIVITNFAIMLWFSVPLTVVVLLGWPSCSLSPGRWEAAPPSTSAAPRSRWPGWRALWRS